MGNATGGSRALHFAALLAGNAALAVGPWWVRMADTGPVAAGFWRLALALPALALFAVVSGQALFGHGRKTMIALAVAGVFFGLDVASWHLGITQTRMGNAVLFGNSGSLVLVAWGLLALHRRPNSNEWLAFAAAIGGSAILMGRSFDIGLTTLVGDLLSLLAGMLYAVYFILLVRERTRLGHWALLTWSSLASMPVMLGCALLLGERVLPATTAGWTPLLMLALTSQVFGQGMLVYAMRHFSPLVLGLALLTQPALGVAIGWAAFGEALGWLDLAGMVLVGAGLVLARERSSKPAMPAAG